MCAGAAKLEQRRMLPVHTPPLVRSVSCCGTARIVSRGQPRVCAFSRSGACMCSLEVDLCRSRGDIPLALVDQSSAVVY